MLSATRLYKSYGKTDVLDGLSLSVSAGTVLGFIGPNGAGKSTAMKILCGIFPPDSGEVSVSGIDMLKDPVRAKADLGYLPENAPLYPGMSVEAFLRYSGRLRGLYGKNLEKSFERVVECCRLKEVLKMDVESLSKGFRRRTCLAQSLIHSPGNLVLDEPTDGLDPDQKREIRSLILELKQTAAIIVSTHILEEIGAVCDQVLAIRNGKSVFYGTAEEFRHLSPDEGTLVLRLDPSSDPAEFESLPEAEHVSFRKDGESFLLKIHPVKGKENILPGTALALASERKYRVLECTILRGDPGRIFASLGDLEDGGNLG